MEGAFEPPPLVSHFTSEAEVAAGVALGGDGEGRLVLVDREDIGYQLRHLGGVGVEDLHLRQCKKAVGCKLSNVPKVHLIF